MKCPHCGVDIAVDARFCGACGRATTGTEPSYKELTGSVPVQTTDLVGREIAGRYRVLAKLGEGGMGAVYRGEQISLKRKVAIKVLRPELSRDPALVRRFNAEAELVARLSHPNTVNIFDFGQDADGSLFIAMEFLEGRSLRQVMQEGPLPPWRALAIAHQIAAALADAHRHGIVHRDLKPDNVMLTERGKDKDVVRVLDFGIAKLRDDDRQTVNAMTRAGDLIGTPQYMAPEQIRGETVDGRTDVYALGAMMYEMLTGRLPFEGPTVMAILSKHLTDTPEPPTARRPDLGLSRELDALVMTALSKDPGLRQPTMERLGDDVANLHAALGGGGAGPRSALIAAPTMPQSLPPMGHQTPLPLPMPSGPPPGVPRTFPPGMMQSVPPQHQHPPQPHAMPPMAAHAPMSAAPGPQPMTPAPTPAAYALSGAPKKSKAPLVAGIVVVLLAGGGAAAFFATRGKSSGDGGGSGGASASGDPDDPWAGSGGGVAPIEEPHVPAPASWGSYTDPSFGWGLKLPPGVSSSPTMSNGAVNFAGFRDGANIIVGAFAAPNQGNDPSRAELDQFGSQLAAQLGARVTESGYTQTQGENRYRIVMETPVDRGEARFYIEPHIIVLAYYTRNTGWDGSASERREFFEGVSIPEGGGM
ncbi:MAG TPA: serine/threonine-protein kinase [Kofleriaceae bacterium]|nr:serine/threonine-protein kinase [Kofleriaceae bacterium]